MAAAAIGSGICIWVKPDPFQLGILPVAPHPKLSLKFLRRIIPYTLTKGSLGYPKLSYSVWRHIACNKLQLPECIAWMYFTTYRTLYRGRPDTRIQWDYYYAEKTGVDERDHLKSLTTVDTLRFVLLLYLQLYNKIVLPAAASLSSEEWPTLDHSVDFVNRSTAHRALKILDERHHLAFVNKKLVEMLDLLSDDLDKPELVGERLVPLEVIEALSFVMEGSLDNNKTVLPLHDLLLSPLMRGKVGFSGSRKAFVYRTVVAFIKRCLGFYPYGVSLCLSFRQPNPYADFSKCSQAKDGSMLTNTATGPKGHRYLVLSRFTKKTIAKSSDTLKGVGVRIHRCHSSYIYLLVPLKFVAITKCRDTTIVLGPVATTVVVGVCKGVRIISVCRRITVSDCQNSTFHLLTPSHPVLIGSRNERLILAPFHTTYPKLEDQMTESGIGHALNLWNNPLCLSDEGNLESRPYWSPMPAEEFYTFNIPFEMGRNARNIPGILAQVYQDALERKRQQVEEWHRMVKSVKFDQEQRDQLNKLVQSRFQIWLNVHGHQKELDSLVSCTTALTSKQSRRAQPKSII